MRLVFFHNNISAVAGRSVRQTKQHLMKTFKITIMQQLKMLAHMILIYPVIFVGIYFSVDDFSNFLISRTLFVITPVFFIIDILPTLILHIQYLIANHHAILEIDTSQKILIYSSPKKMSLIHFRKLSPLFILIITVATQDFILLLSINFSELYLTTATSSMLLV